MVSTGTENYHFWNVFYQDVPGLARVVLVSKSRICGYMGGIAYLKMSASGMKLSAYKKEIVCVCVCM